MLDKAQYHIDKELDLRKFLDKMRMLLTSILGLLTPKQRLFVEKMSKNIVINDDKINSE